MTQVHLVRFAPAHHAAFAALLDDPGIQENTRFPVPAPPDFVTTWAAAYDAGWADGSRANFAALDADDAFVGFAIALVDRPGLTAELGHAVVPERRGEGLAAMILSELTSWALGEQLVRLGLSISDTNLASQAVARRCGYVYEGTQRSLYVKPDVRHDTQSWSLLSTDPRSASEAAGVRH